MVSVDDGGVFMMPRRAPTPAFFHWEIWGLPAFAAALAPWHDKIIKATLIPEWYQPSLNITASAISPLICFATYYVLDGSGTAKLRFVMKLSLISLISSILVCLALMYAIDVWWFPEPGVQIALRVFWSALYLNIFATFGVALVCGIRFAKR
jgi:hypothetical protein